MSDFITANQVAERIGYNNGHAFLMARERLEREKGFPPPMPTCLRPLKWRASAVEAWLQTQGQLPQITADLIPAGPNVHLLKEARRA